VARPKPAKLRFYVDADTLGLAHLLTAVRSDVTYSGDPGGIVDSRERPACEIEPATPDHEWIPLVAAQGLVVITRDRRISQRTAEKAAVRETGGRAVAITSQQPLRKFEILEVVICQWRKRSRNSPTCRARSSMASHGLVSANLTTSSSSTNVVAQCRSGP
jgi:PIN like domain